MIKQNRIPIAGCLLLDFDLNIKHKQKNVNHFSVRAYIHIPGILYPQCVCSEDTCKLQV